MVSKKIIKRSLKFLRTNSRFLSGFLVSFLLIVLILEFIYFSNLSENLLKNPNENLTDFLNSECSPLIQCLNWSYCDNDYKFQGIVHNELIFSGVQERVCIDTHNCVNSFIENQSCELFRSSFVKRVDFNVPSLSEDSNLTKMNTITNLNVYDSDSRELVGKIIITPKESYKKIEIKLMLSNLTESYDHCFNGFKDADEEGLDCGGVCELCSIQYSPERGFDYLSIVIFILWTLLILLVVNFFLLKPGILSRAFSRIFINSN